MNKKELKKRKTEEKSKLKRRKHAIKLLAGESKKQKKREKFRGRKSASIREKSNNKRLRRIHYDLKKRSKKSSIGKRITNTGDHLKKIWGSTSIQKFWCQQTSLLPTSRNWREISCIDSTKRGVSVTFIFDRRNPKRSSITE